MNLKKTLTGLELIAALYSFSYLYFVINKILSLCTLLVGISLHGYSQLHLVRNVNFGSCVASPK